MVKERQIVRLGGMIWTGYSAREIDEREEKKRERSVEREREGEDEEHTRSDDRIPAYFLAISLSSYISPLRKLKHEERENESKTERTVTRAPFSVSVCSFSVVITEYRGVAAVA